MDTWYLSGGFDGNFSVGEREMYWDVTAIRSENNAKQTKLNQFNARSLNVAMGDPAVCAITPGCTPLNIVGEGSMTQEMLTSSPIRASTLASPIDDGHHREPFG